MAIVGTSGDTTIQVTEGSGASLVILIALLILFGGAFYFTGRLYGKTGAYAVLAGFILVVSGLYFLGGLSFS